MKKVDVLMSTYNGAKYLKEQIDSIMEQENVDISITIRDDGSKDNTISIIEEMQKKYIDKIRLIKGENKGYKVSFALLLGLARDDVDYYAFADQDDVWKKEKTHIGVEKLQQGYELYICSVENVDENLKHISLNDFTNGVQSLKSDFIRHRFSGCTMVFTNKVRMMAYDVAVNKMEYENMPSHDFIVSTVAYLLGDVYVDGSSYILHRRTKDSLTSRGKGLINRIRTEYKVVFKYKNEYSTMAAMLLRNKHIAFKESDKAFLLKIKNHKNGFYDKIKLITEKNFTNGIKICDIETKFKILIGNY